jgi:ligand-binding sensor domain-containing protein
MMSRILYIWLTIHTFFHLTAYAQLSNLKFRHLTSTEGLSQDHVSAILKDHAGFMWFGTDEGLNKYDGYKFTAYKSVYGNTKSISGNFIVDLYEDVKGNLWVGTTTGLDLFDRKRETFEHFTNNGEVLSVRHIFQDSENQMWIGTTDGLYKFNPVNRSFKKYTNDPENPSSISNNFIYRIAEFDGDLWIATPKGLNRFDRAKELFICYKHDPRDPGSLASSRIKTVYQTSERELWVGTQGGGVSLYNKEKKSFRNFVHDENDPASISHNDVRCIAEGSRGELWVGSENGGISILDRTNGKFKTYQYDPSDPTSLSNNSIYCLYYDNVGNMWVGTWSGGVNLFPRFREKFAHYKNIAGNTNSLSHNNVLSIKGDDDGNIWIGTDGGGINKLDWKKKQFTHFNHSPFSRNSPSTDYVICTSNVGNGVMAFGYHRSGFDLLNTRTGKFTHFNSDDETTHLSGLSVHVVHRDRNNQFWIGTVDRNGLYLFEPGDLYRFDSKMKKSVHYPTDRKSDVSLGGTTVYSIFEDSENTLWIGTNGGLDKFDVANNQFIHHTFDPKNKTTLSNNVVYAITEDKKGNLWIGTGGGGLNMFDRKSNIFTSYTEADGLSNNVIYGILEDDHGNLWVSSNKGITKFNPVTKSVRNYGVSDGLQGNSFKPNACYKNATGEMFFGGANGFNVFHPDSITDNTIVPPVSLTGLHVLNQSQVNDGDSAPMEEISSLPYIELSYDQSVITFEYAALNYISPELNQYAYKLENFDKDWNYVGRQRIATYTNLDPGEYTFLVKGSNNDGIWNDNPASIKVIVTPPFWQTWWFRVVVVCIALTAAYISVRMRISRVHKQKSKLKRQVRKRTQKITRMHDELKAQSKEIKSINENLEEIVKTRTIELERKNKALREYAYINAHKVRGPVASMLGLIDLISRTELTPDAEQMFEYLKKSAEDLDSVVHSVTTAIENGEKTDDATTLPNASKSVEKKPNH